MGKKSKAATVKAKNKKIDPSELPKDKPPPLAEEVSCVCVCVCVSCWCLVVLFLLLPCYSTTSPCTLWTHVCTLDMPVSIYAYI